MSYRFPKCQIRSLLKRITDLKGRKSHQDFEVERELADLLYLALEVPWWRIPCKIRFLLAIHKAESMHKECCGIKSSL